MSFQLSGNAAEIYENTLVPLWFGRWARELLDLVALKPGEAVLDIACGTGVTTRLAAQAVGGAGRVVGLDVNEGMLATARELAPDSATDWLLADAARTGLAAGSFDAIIAQHGYHYFPDKPASLAEFLRLLKPGGRVALSIWAGHSPYTAALCDALARYISPEIAQKQHSQRAAPSPEELAAQLEAAGFGDVNILRQDLQIEVPLAATFVPLHLSSMPIAAAYHGLDDAAKAALAGDVADALQDYVVGDALVYPDAVHVMTGVKV